MEGKKENMHSQIAGCDVGAGANGRVSDAAHGHSARVQADPLAVPVIAQRPFAMFILCTVEHSESEQNLSI